MKYLVFLFFFSSTLLQAQTKNDTVITIKKYPQTSEGNKFEYKQIIIPSTLIALGVYGSINGHLDHKIADDNWGKHTDIDDVLPFVSPSTVYILNWSGYRGKHNFIDRSVILGTSALLALGTTQLMKSTISVKRPNGKSDDSFPSMHTATAFVGAEFLYQEYKDQSIWLGIAGYGIATCTGFLRIYNNKHWLSDTLVGAGLGILGTKTAYWLYPEVRKLYQNTKLDHAMIVPFGSTGSYGLSLSLSF